MAYAIIRFIGDAKKYAREGEWETIDKKIVPMACRYNSSSLAAYLPPLFKSKYGNLRDLAGTLAAELKVEQLSHCEIATLRGDLQRELFTDKKNAFARFRAAVALAKLGLYETRDVKAIKRVFSSKKIQGDQDLRKIAQKYIRALQE